jgi:ribosomal protein L11 methyltransferase
VSARVVRRYTLRVPAERAEQALLRMLELFPEGVEEETDGSQVVLHGYGDRPPTGDLEETAVAEGWADAWREFHRPVRVGRLWVGPPWYDPEPIAVVIDPGRAFGTGAHPSTRAALELMQRLTPSPMLDLGCGSGVLSIAAIRLGFGPVCAFDRDPLAVGATADNAAANHVSVKVAAADVLCDPLPATPLWVANLQLDLLELLLRRHDLSPTLVVSGLLRSQTLGGGERVELDGWAAEVLRR